jgi:hypothetical protein
MAVHRGLVFTGFAVAGIDARRPSPTIRAM